VELKPGYQNTDIGVFPNDWRISALGELASFKTGPFGSALHKSDYVQGGVPVVNPMQIVDGKIRPSPSMAISDHAARKLSEFRLSEGDVVIGRRGEMGRCAYVSGTEDGWLCGTGSMIIRTTASLDAEFLQRLLSSRRVIADIEKASVGSTMINLNQRTLARLRIATPPTILEQDRISRALSDVDALIASLEQLLAKEREIKQGAMQELLTGRKRLPGFSGYWGTRQLGDLIIHCSSGATPYRGNVAYYKGDVKWITSGELKYNVITDTIEHISQEAVHRTRLKIHPAGTFLMAITGLEAAGTRGACGIVGLPAATNQSCMAIYPSPELTTTFLYHWYVFRGSDLALRYCQGTKQQSYTAKLVKLLPIDLPPTVDEQVALGAALGDFDTEIAALEQRIRKIKLIKQGMMQELLTGRIRLVDVQKAPELELVHSG
jgi:type I restriction enzyme, S subunit